MNRIWFYIALSISIYTASCIGPHYYYINKKGEKGVYHKVEKGQTLWRISRAYGVDLETLAKVNRLGETLEIEKGAYIFIPGAAKTIDVRPYPAPLNGSLLKEPSNGTENPAAPPSVFQWPVEGRLSSAFGQRNGRRHEGIDITAPEGTEIKAASDGVVTHSGWGPGEYGKAVIITHKDGYTTLYGHNSYNTVSEGAYVKAGQVIGRVGRTGNATGNHLHFEIRKDGVPVNPLLYLP